jgi:hypothetical protein
MRKCIYPYVSASKIRTLIQILFRARAKFLRAKRLANGKDTESMSQILGIKSNSASANASPISSPVVTEETVQVMENTTMVPMTVNQMSVQDYFASKLKNVKVSGIATSGFSKSWI